MTAIDRRQACPYCGADEERESERDYPHWRQFGCGSLLISPEESDGVEQSQKCRVRQRDLMVDAVKEDLGNAMVRIAELEAKLDADGSRNAKELVDSIVAHCDSFPFPDFVSDLNPTDQQRIRDAQMWILSIGQLRVIAAALEAK